MRIHKRIIVNQEEMEKVLFYRILVEGAKYLIEKYNFYKSKEIEFEFNWHQGVSRGGGYEHGSDLELMDNFFVNTLKMKKQTIDRNNSKTAIRIYYFED